jgi:acyl carrier protein
MTKEDILAKVQGVLVDALNVDDDEVSPQSRLRDDLGAESIDFLDIVFRLEREFNIKIPRGELFPEEILQGDPELIADGKVTEKGVEAIKTKMPFADTTLFEKNPTVEGIYDLFTVETVVRYIQGKLAAK